MFKNSKLVILNICFPSSFIELTFYKISLSHIELLKTSTIPDIIKYIFPFEGSPYSIIISLGLYYSNVNSLQKSINFFIY